MNLPGFRDLARASRQVATTSAMNPILWVTVICSPFGMVCSSLTNAPLSYYLLALSSLPLIVACIIYVLFAVKDPDRLQSERHVENMQVISRFGVNSDEGGMEILLPNRAKMIDNPSVKDDAP